MTRFKNFNSRSSTIENEESMFKMFQLIRSDLVLVSQFNSLDLSIDILVDSIVSVFD